MPFMIPLLWVTARSASIRASADSSAMRRAISSPPHDRVASVCGCTSTRAVAAEAAATLLLSIAVSALQPVQPSAAAATASHIVFTILAPIASHGSIIRESLTNPSGPQLLRSYGLQLLQSLGLQPLPGLLPFRLPSGSSLPAKPSLPADSPSLGIGLLLPAGTPPPSISTLWLSRPPPYPTIEGWAALATVRISSLCVSSMRAIRAASMPPRASPAAPQLLAPLPA